MLNKKSFLEFWAFVLEVIFYLDTCLYLIDSSALMHLMGQFCYE